MLSLKSPAKINLFLRILGPRPDGYHEIASLFQTIDLFDTIHFQIANNDSLTCSDHTLSTGEDNLVAKARNIFRRKTEIDQCYAIDLQKNIPVQAGLGGGSSNAATTLWALNELNGRPVSVEQLAGWGSEIGSDVSFFCSCGTAYCTGRGDVLREVSKLKSQDLWVVKPLEGLSTPAVYANLKMTELDNCDPEQALALFINHQPHYFNDLEHAAFSIKPELAILKQELCRNGFSTVLMSGSGSSFFCIGDGDISGISGCQVYRTSYVNRQANAWY